MNAGSTTRIRPGSTSCCDERPRAARRDLAARPESCLDAQPRLTQQHLCKAGEKADGQAEDDESNRGRTQEKAAFLLVKCLAEAGFNDQEKAAAQGAAE